MDAEGHAERRLASNHEALHVYASVLASSPEESVSFWDKDLLEARPGSLVLQGTYDG